MKIGFIGCGNMASAIIKGIICNKVADCKDIYAYDISSKAASKAKSEYNINICDSEADTAQSVDILFLAVKPNVIGSVIETLSDTLKSNNPLVISIAAGKTLEYLSACSKSEFKLVRVMPNINAKVGESICAYCSNSLVTDDDIAVVSKILSGIGKVLALDESYFPLFGVLGGCGPAFAYMFIDAMARAGVKNGMKKEDALKIAAQTVYGSAKMILESDEHPWKLIDNVCSPGGTTIEGVTSLQADGFENAIHNAVDKALDKDKKL